MRIEVMLFDICTLTCGERLMKLDGSQVIAADRDTVWKALNNPDVLHASIPGCQKMTQVSPVQFEAVVQQKIGPVKATFNGVVHLHDVVEGQSLTLSGEGKGGVAGMAKGSAKVSLSDVPGGTEVSYDADASVAGRIAQLGSRLIDGVANRMANTFFENFKAAVEGEGVVSAETGSAGGAIVAGSALGAASGLAGDAVSGIAGGAADAVTGAIGGVTGAAGEAVSGVTDAVSGIAGGAADAVTGAVGGVTGAAGEAFSGVTDAVSGIAGGAADAVTGAVGGVTDAAGDGATNVAAGVAAAVAGGGVAAAAASGAKGTYDRTEDAIKSLKGPDNTSASGGKPWYLWIILALIIAVIVKLALG